MNTKSLHPRDPRAELRWRRRLRRLLNIGFIFSGFSVGSVLLASALMWWLPSKPLISGVIWQPTLDYSEPHGQWQQLGANTLLVQWLISNGRAWRSNLGAPVWDPKVDWKKLEKAAWAKNMILGLAGDYELSRARENWRRLAIQSQTIVKHINKPAHAWYAPIEISPDWTDVRAIRSYVQALPRPLWVSIYRSNKLSPEQFARWVQSWLPDGVRVMFQDGVGTGQSSPLEAGRYAQALVDELGRQRVAIVLEAFKTSVNSSFEPADIKQLKSQLAVYRALQIRIFVFSCRYINVWQVLRLKWYAWLSA